MPSPLAIPVRWSSRQTSRGAARVAVLVALTVGVSLATVGRRALGRPTAPAPVALALTDGDTVRVYGPRRFDTPTGSATYHVERFAIGAEPGKRYTLQVDNGGVTGGSVILNGSTILSATDLGSGAARWTRVVQALSEDTIQVTVQGGPGASVTVTLLATPDASTLVFGPERFTRTTGIPSTDTRHFTMTATAGAPYRLCIVNGNPDGTNRLSSATIVLNGVTVLTQSELNQQVGGLVKQVTLQQTNTVSITLTAKPHGFLDLCFQATDVTPPVITITQPPNNLITRENQVAVTGSVQDETATTVTVNGLPASMSGASFRATVALTSEGPNALHVVATDAAGLSTDSTRTVIRDTQTPILTLSTPADGLITTQPSVLVSGTVTDATVVTVNVNGIPLSVGTDGAFAGTLALTEGTNTLTVTATDAVGNQTVELRTVTRDTQAPVLTVTAPADQLITKETAIAVSGTATDASPVTVTVNGTPLAVGAGGAFTGPVALVEGVNTLTITATDGAGNATTVGRTVTRDTQAPILIVTAPADHFLTKLTAVTVSGTVTDATPVTVDANAVPLPVDGAGVFTGSVSLAEGANPLTITATDAAGNVATAVRIVTRDTHAPVIAVAAPADGALVDAASVVTTGTVTDASPTTLTVNGAPFALDAGGSFSGGVALTIGLNTVSYVATDAAGNVGTASRSVTRQAAGPPDPIAVATVVNQAEATLMQENTAFLYAGANPVQTGVAPGTIAFLRAAVLRGRVLDRALAPLADVAVTVKDHPELGRTVTRGDGRYDLAVNGGGTLVLDFAKSGYFPAQRGVVVPWQDYTPVDDVILVAPDAAVTVVDLTTTQIQVARGSVQSDGDGPRQATVFFEPGTQATLRRADGTTQLLTSLTVRATEFTVGEHGAAAMPAELPPASQYTYAVQVSADEQLAAGPGAVITFSQPVPLYVENFLDFPVGTAVPVGAYDAAAATWRPRPNGLVLKVTGTDAQGRALLDINGDGVPDSDSLLVFNGIDALERVRIAGTYPVNSALWRVPIIETLPQDLNWPFVLVGGDAPRSAVTGPCGSEGADVLRCSLQVQTAFQRVGIAGSPFTLNYASDRTPGNVADRRLEIQLVGAAVPPFLERVDLEIDIAGRRFEASFQPAPNLTHTFVWDGKDVYGRPVQATQPARVRVGYLYPVLYGVPAAVAQSFGLPCIVAPCQFQAPPEVRESIRALRRVWESIPTTLGGFDATGAGLGGFTLDVQHAYDPIGGQFYGGDGTRRVAATLPDQVTRWAGTGDPGTAGSVVVNNVPKTQSIISNPAGLVVAPDGSVYVVDAGRARVRKVSPDGIITTVAGTGGAAFNGDDRLATTAQLTNPWGLALGPDGSLYIGEQNGRHAIRRIGPDGFIRAVAGDGTCGLTGDNGPATAARVCQVVGMGVGPDGSLYFADSFNNRIRKIGPDGIIRTVAGMGNVGGGSCFSPGTSPAPAGLFESVCGEGIPATRALLRNPTGLTVGPDGTVYFAQQIGGRFSSRIRRIDPAGFIYVFAGGDVPATQLNEGGSAKQAQLGSLGFAGMTVGPDGSVYFTSDVLGAAVPEQYVRARRVRPDGRITTVAGDGTTGTPLGDNGPARRARFGRLEGVAVTQAGDLLLSDDAEVRLVSAPLPGLLAGSTVIASPDGSELYVFSPAGRILLTLDALTADTMQRFAYDGQRRLVAITDRDGGTTTIERDGAGTPTRILAPNGQPTVVTLDPDGRIAALTDAGNEALRLEFGTSGLLNGITDFNGNSPSHEYDASGRLLTSSGGPGTAPIVRSVVTTASGDELHYTSAAGVESFGQVANLPGGGRSYQGTLPDGRVMATTVGPDGTVTTRFADGTVAIAVPLPDPVFGMQTPGSRLTTTLPSGLVHDQRAVRAVTLAIPGDPLSLVQQVDSLVTNGRIALTTFTKAAGTRTRRTPTGRMFVSTLDAAGRESTETAPGMFPVSYEYDGAGRVTRIAQSARVENRIYGPNGLLQQSTDALGRVARRSHTATGLLTELIRPGGDTIRFEYDANGNRTAIVPPGRSPHLFGVTAIGRRETYTAPAVGPTPTITRWSYNADGALIGVEHPDGGDVLIERDSASHVRTVTTPTGQQTYAYDPASGRVATTVSEHGVVTSFTYDGLLLKSTEWSGSAVGRVSNIYDANHWLISQAAGNGPPIQFDNDRDGLPTRAGDLTISRNAASGAITGTTLGGFTSQWVVDGYGDLAALEYRFGTVVQLRLAYTRNALGRVVAVSEVRNSDSTGTTFGFDSVGGLTSVVANGMPVASYEYDANGNRTLVTTPSGTMQGIVDAQDRLLALGGTSYKYSANGQLVAKVSGNDTTRYEYDGALRLTAVSLPSGRRVSYLLDADGRRVARAIDGVVERRFVYGSGFTLLAEVDGTGSATSRFVYGTRANVPDYMVKGGTVYGLVTDQAGSVRLVIDVTNGAVAQELAYDAFGRVTVNTNPGFQPFAFAGGVLDSETGLMHFGVRDYDPYTGRWTSKDPILFDGGDWNLYTYAHNDPINYIDPTGTWSLPELSFTMGWQSFLKFLRNKAIEQVFGILESAAERAITGCITGDLSINGQKKGCLANARDEALGLGGLVAIGTDVVTKSANPFAAFVISCGVDGVTDMLAADVDDQDKSLVLGCAGGGLQEMVDVSLKLAGATGPVARAIAISTKAVIGVAFIIAQKRYQSMCEDEPKSLRCRFN